MTKLIVLDRDGVLNHDSDDYIKSPDEWCPIDGSLEAVARLNHAGFQVAVITNQSGVGRGLFDIETLSRIHQKMHRALAAVGAVVDVVLFCPHRPDEGCQCRKPHIGLYRSLAVRLGEPLRDVYCVGDSLKDLQAARAVGGRPVLVRTGKGERTLRDAPAEELQHVPVFDHLAHFAQQRIHQADTPTAGRER